MNELNLSLEDHVLGIPQTWSMRIELDGSHHPAALYEMVAKSMVASVAHMMSHGWELVGEHRVKEKYDPATNLTTVMATVGIRPSMERY
jgi:hypothetical protein